MYSFKNVFIKLHYINRMLSLAEIFSDTESLSVSQLWLVETLSNTSRRFSLSGNHIRWIQFLIQPRQCCGKHKAKTSWDWDGWANSLSVHVVHLCCFHRTLQELYMSFKHHGFCLNPFFSVSQSWERNGNSLTEKVLIQCNKTLYLGLVLTTTFVITI